MLQNINILKKTDNYHKLSVFRISTGINYCRQIGKLLVIDIVRTNLLSDSIFCRQI